MKMLQVLGLAVAVGLGLFGQTNVSDATTRISNDRGGQVIKYALRVLKLKKSGGRVAITGRCASACTLHLSLPRQRMCISPGASFAFHLPYGASREGNSVARSYLMRSYPQWVRKWIANQGGLSSRMITMNYKHASRYLPTCKSATLPSLIPLRTSASTSAIAMLAGTSISTARKADIRPHSWWQRLTG